MFYSFFAVWFTSMLLKGIFNAGLIGIGLLLASIALSEI